MRPILLKGHDGPLTCVRYNKDGDLLFTTCRRGRINLWYSDDGERIGTFNSGAKPGAVMYVDVNCECVIALPTICSAARCLQLRMLWIFPHCAS
jgi:translation initiation factor 3 subunit I